LLGKMCAEQRLAVFLNLFAAEQGARGYSASRLHLTMTREDIANHLGLSPECVSRVLARFRRDGLVYIANREIEIRDAPALQTIADGQARASDRVLSCH
jgi:CRP/FNR family transcriptional regulator